MTWTRRRKALAGLAVAALLVLSIPLAVYYATPRPSAGQQCTADPGLCISATLTVRAYHAGQSAPYYDRSFPNDPIVDQFNKLLIDVFDRGSGVGVQNSASTYIGSAWGCAAYGCGTYLEIGTTAGTSRSDTTMNAGYTPSGGALQIEDTGTNPVQITNTAANPATCNTGTTDTITGISGSQPITGSVTIQEAGLFVYYDAGDLNQMVSHDTISPGISASNGDTVTVAYQINLSNVGLTTNFCKVLASWLSGNLATGDYESTSLYNTADTANAYYTVCSPVGTNWGFYTSSSCTAASQFGRLGIGTGTTAFTPAAVALTAQVGSTTQIAGIGYLSSTMYWTSTITVSTSNTIGEVGLFVYTTTSGNILMFATTLSPTQSETASTPYGQTIRLGD
jgi:hypothetical protein